MLPDANLHRTLPVCKKYLVRVAALFIILALLMTLYCQVDSQKANGIRVLTMLQQLLEKQSDTDYCYDAMPQANQPRCSDLPAHYSDSIPPFVHWISKDGRVPPPLISIVKSWRLLSTVWPTSWRFMHWDDNQIEQLINTHYPQLAISYSKLVNSLERSDMGRLVVLHHVGGVYVDMEVELRRDLSPLLAPSHHVLNTEFMSSTCCSAILSQEPTIESSALNFNMPRLLSNAVMLARANHSFLSYFLREWPAYFQANWDNNSTRRHTDANFVTGPAVLHQFYDRYLNIEPANRHSDWSGTYLAQPEVFQPMWDDSAEQRMLREICGESGKHVPRFWREACIRRAFIELKARPVPPESFTVNRFRHLRYAYNIDMGKSMKINEILPILECKI